MGSRRQTLNRQIDGTDGIILEVNTYSYKKYLTYNLNLNVYMNKNLFGKRIIYYNWTKRSTSKPQNKV